MYPFGLVVDRWVVANYEGEATLRGVFATATEGGVSGLFRGYSSNVSKIVASGLMLMFYGETKRLLVSRR